MTAAATAYSGSRSAPTDPSARRRAAQPFTVPAPARPTVISLVQSPTPGVRTVTLDRVPGALQQEEHLVQPAPHGDLPGGVPEPECRRGVARAEVAEMHHVRPLHQVPVQRDPRGPAALRQVAAVSRRPGQDLPPLHRDRADPAVLVERRRPLGLRHEHGSAVRRAEEVRLEVVRPEVSGDDAVRDDGVQEDGARRRGGQLGLRRREVLPSVLRASSCPRTGRCSRACPPRWWPERRSWRPGRPRRRPAPAGPSAPATPPRRPRRRPSSRAAPRRRRSRRPAPRRRRTEGRRRPVGRAGRRAG